MKIAFATDFGTSKVSILVELSNGKQLCLLNGISTMCLAPNPCFEFDEIEEKRLLSWAKCMHEKRIEKLIKNLENEEKE